jgi:CxxC motif-containing protein (DUF1111 family)
MDDSKTQAGHARAGAKAKAANVRHHLKKLFQNDPGVTKATRDKQFEALDRAVKDCRRHGQATMTAYNQWKESK